MDEYYWKEWERIVLDAQQQLHGTCPLLDDEVIIKVNEYIKELKLQLNKKEQSKDGN